MNPTLPALALVLVAFGSGRAPAQQSLSPQIELEHWRLPNLDQGRTGTCWCFSTTSFLESEIHRLSGRSVDLSEMYNVYQAYLEKARRYVRLHGKTQFGQGGLSHDVIYDAEHHGLMPQAVYSGLREGPRYDHRTLERELTELLQRIAGERRPDPDWETRVREVLDRHLGAPPATFEAGGKTVTPEQFAAALKLPLGDYREVMSFRSQPMWHEAELLVPDNWLRYQRYWNVPLDTLLESLDYALREGFTVAIDIDVSEPTTRHRNKVWQLSPELEAEGAVTPELRQHMFDTRETTDDHLMHIVGIAHDENGRRLYVTKDSTGPDASDVLISRSYLAAKMLAFMVHRDGLSADVRRRFEGK